MSINVASILNLESQELERLIFYYEDCLYKQPEATESKTFVYMVLGWDFGG